jgi:hypothetical protein
MQWQPIETAPKDGAYIFLCPWGDAPDAFVSFWLAGECRWANCEFAEHGLTHWMPLPEPPK